MIDRGTAGATNESSDRELRLLLRMLLVVTTVVFTIASGAAFYFLTSAAVGSSYFDVVPSVRLFLDPDQAVLAQLSAAEAEGVTDVISIVDTRTDGAGYRVWALVNGLGAAALAAGLWLVRSIITSVTAADPFVRANVGRLKAIGLLLATVPVVVSVGEGIAADLLVESANGAVFDLDMSWMFAGLLVLVVAEVWSQGIDMRDELELTI